MNFLALLDSGADCSLFNSQIAEVLGVDITKGVAIKMTGINGESQGYRLENVAIIIEGSDKIIKIPVCFIDSPTVGILLGQEGFFDQNRIKFEKDHDTFEINPVKNSK